MDAAGTGGLSELKDYLSNQSKNIIFFLLRININVNKNSTKTKFIYGRFVGTQVINKYYILK